MMLLLRGSYLESFLEAELDARLRAAELQCSEHATTVPPLHQDSASLHPLEPLLEPSSGDHLQDPGCAGPAMLHDDLDAYLPSTSVHMDEQLQTRDSESHPHRVRFMEGDADVTAQLLAPKQETKPWGLFSPEAVQRKLLQGPPSQDATTPMDTGRVLNSLVTPAGQRTTHTSTGQHTGVRNTVQRPSALTPFPGYIGPAGLLLTSPSPNVARKSPGRPQTAMPMSARRNQQMPGMRRALSLGPALPSSLQLPDLNPNSLFSPAAGQEPDILRLDHGSKQGHPTPSAAHAFFLEKKKAGSSGLGARTRIRSPDEAELDDRDDPEYIPSGLRGTRASARQKSNTIPAVHMRPEVHPEEARRSRPARNRKPRAHHHQADDDQEGEPSTSRRPKHIEEMHLEHRQLNTLNRQLKGDLRHLLGKLEATQRENKLVKQLAGVLAFEPQALLEQPSCTELDKFRARVAASTGNTASWGSPNVAGSSLNAAEGAAAADGALRGVEDDAARQRAKEILEEGLPKMTGFAWPPTGAYQAITPEQAHQVALQALASSDNDATEALAKLLTLALRMD
ncbi:hypothetical protein WJX73_000251 [Symbiochloris irregularis]|uniref:Uncharacterized protein n=1 Tax=Symbiochloris irregularis TaxID=706552 RepID=A0AAW1P1D8_9CHLO